MSDLKAYRIDECGRMIEDSEPDEDSWAMWLSAQSELAALREELASAKRNEHNSEVAYKAAIEKQEELRAELAELEEEFDTLEHANITLKLSLADAERRNDELLDMLRMAWADEYVSGEDCKRIDAALNPRPEAVSHDE